MTRLAAALARKRGWLGWALLWLVAVRLSPLRPPQPRAIIADDGGVAAIWFADAGRRLVLAESDDEGARLRVADAETGRSIARIACGEQLLLDRRGAPRIAVGEVIVAERKPGILTAVDPRTGAILGEGTVAAGSVFPLAFAPDGTVCHRFDGAGLEFWDWRTRTARIWRPAEGGFPLDEAHVVGGLVIGWSRAQDRFAAWRFADGSRQWSITAEGGWMDGAPVPSADGSRLAWAWRSMNFKVTETWLVDTVDGRILLRAAGHRPERFDAAGRLMTRVPSAAANLPSGAGRLLRWGHEGQDAVEARESGEEFDPPNSPWTLARKDADGRRHPLVTWLDGALARIGLPTPPGSGVELTVIDRRTGRSVTWEPPAARLNVWNNGAMLAVSPDGTRLAVAGEALSGLGVQVHDLPPWGLLRWHHPLTATMFTAAAWLARRLALATAAFVSAARRRRTA